MRNDILIEKAIKYITELFEGNSDGHDVSHAIRVFRTAAKLAEHYPDADSQVICLAAILHDADDHKLFESENNENARKFLDSICMNADKTDKICQVINSVSFSKNKGRRPESIEGCIVQDADRLDAMGAIGIARTFAYGGGHGRSIEDSMKHFYEKLLLLKDGINTPEAMKIAEERHKVLEAYIRELEAEMSE